MIRPPSLPPQSSPNFLQRTREEIQRMLGLQGDPLDQVVRVRDLKDAGIAALSPLFGRGGAMFAGLGSAAAHGGGAAARETDLTPPPPPEGFVADGTFFGAFVRCADALYTQGGGHARSRLYGGQEVAGQPLPVFAGAVELADFVGSNHKQDFQPGTTWRLWLTWITQDGVEGPPAGGTNGVAAAIDQSPDVLVEALRGRIAETELFQALGQRIALIDGAGAGSVNARIAAEAVERSGADAANRAAVVALSETVASNDSARATEISQVSTTVGGHTATLQTQQSSIDGLRVQYTVSVDVDGLAGGFVLAGGGGLIDFGIRANRFFIAGPSGAAKQQMFTYLTTPQTIDGFVVQPGAYMDAASVINFAATLAKIKTAYIDNAHLANVTFGAMTGGTIKVGSWMQSTNYVQGVQGWRLSDTTAQLPATSVIGKLTADQIDARGLEIKDAAGNLILGANTPLTVSRIAGLGALATKSNIFTSGNLLSNSDFSDGTTGWSFGDAGSGTDGYPNNGINRPNADWIINRGVGPSTNNITLHSNAPQGYYAEWGSTSIPVKPGDKMIASAYTGAHRCEVVVFAYFYDASANVVGNLGGWVTNNEEASGGTSLSGWKRTYSVGVVPAGAATARLILRKNATKAGYADSWMFASRAMIEVVGADVNEPTPWALAGVQQGDISLAGTTANWGGVSGAGKPQDNATVGAQIGVNLSGQFNSGNISTFMDAAFVRYLVAQYAQFGSLSAIIANLGTVTAGTILSGRTMGGAYSGYGWPGGTAGGYYLGPEGLLLGNPNNGKYLQVTADGNIYTPKFRVENGVMTIDQANVIKTLNIADNSVTIPAVSTGGGNISVNNSYTQSLSVNTPGGRYVLFLKIDAVSNTVYSESPNGGGVNAYHAVIGVSVKANGATVYSKGNTGSVLVNEFLILSAPEGALNIVVIITNSPGPYYPNPTATIDSRLLFLATLK